MDIEGTIKQIFANLFQIRAEIIQEKTSSDDIHNWDSLHHLNLVLSLEEEFDIRITPEESTEMLNFRLIVLLVKEKLAEKEIAP